METILKSPDLQGGFLVDNTVDEAVDLSPNNPGRRR